MAERRMFAKTIIDSDAFLDMSVTARLLYYDLSMRADDDGFVNSPKKIMRMIGASEDDLRMLAARKFIIPFENGVVVIKHWRIHNYIRKDTYNETPYKEQKQLLELDENNAYRLLPSVDAPSTSRGRSVDEPSTQVRLGKDRVGKDSKIYSSVPELNDAILSFIDFRRKMRKPMTDRAINLLISKLNSITSDTNEQIEVINQSILNGWAGVFPLKGGGSNGKDSGDPAKSKWDLPGVIEL